MSSWIPKPLLFLWNQNRPSEAPREKVDKEMSDSPTDTNTSEDKDNESPASTTSPTNKGDKGISKMSSEPSRPPAPASLPPPSIPIDLKKKKETSASSGPIPSLSSKPSRGGSIPPPPTNNRSEAGSPSSFRIVYKPDLDQAKQELNAHSKKLQDEIERINLQLESLSGQIKPQEAGSQQNPSDIDRRLEKIENDLSQQHDEWYNQVEERDEALFDLKLSFETAHNKLSAELKRRDIRIQELETKLGEIQDRCGQLEDVIDQLRKSSIVQTGDDLTRIKGIGPGYARSLKAMGITTFEQIAALTDEDLDGIAPQIKISPQRIRRQGWIDSAKALLAETQNGNSEPELPFE